MQENIFTDVLQWGGVSFVFIPFLLYLKSLEKHLASWILTGSESYLS